jgi:hypothetical protein
MTILCCLDAEAGDAETAALLDLGRRMSAADAASPEPGGAGALVLAVASTAPPPPELRIPGAGASPEALPSLRWLRDPALSSDNPRAVGLALAHLARHVGATVCLAGVGSRARGLGLVPAALARHLAASYVAMIDNAALVAGALEVTIRLGPRLRRLRVPTPAVLTCAAAGDEDAAPCALTPVLVTPAELGLDPALLNGRRELLGDHTPVPPALRYVTRARDVLE